MKGCKLLIFCGLMLMSVVSQAQTTEDLFSYNSDNSVSANSKFVTEFDWPSFMQNKTFHTYSTSSVALMDSEFLYDLKLEEVKGLTGKFCKINIMHRGSNILTINDIGGWDDIFPNYSANFKQVRLSKDAMALVFVGYNDASVQPGFLTIVVLNKGRATLVYNDYMYIRDLYETSGDLGDHYSMNSFKINLLKQCPSNSSDDTRKPDMVIEKVEDKLVVKR